MKNNVVELVSNVKLPAVHYRTTPLTEEDAAIGALLRQERDARGLTQEFVAQKCGFSFQFLQKLEKGKNRLSIHRLIQISRAVGFNPARFVSKLYAESPATESDQTLFALLKEPGASKLLTIWSSMKPKQREALLKVARALVDDDGA